MIFTVDMAAKVLAGEKTVTRRPCYADTCRYVVGRTYAVQSGRGARSIGRIRIVSVRREELCAVTAGDWRAEGFATFAGFMAKWRELYDLEIDWLQPVWRIEFALASDREAV